MQHFLENYPILYYEEVDSTNVLLKQKVRDEKIAAPFAIAAGFQSAGKGQRQNVWQSEGEKNVLCSFLVQGFSLHQLPHVANAAVVAICKTLAAFGINEVTVKWPNDIFVGNKKIAGILIENIIAGSELKNCIVGIGLNVNQTENLLTTATSMALAKNSQFLPKDILVYLFQSFYGELQKDAKELLASINAVLYKKNEMVTFLIDESNIQYKVLSILANGNLLVEHYSQFLELQHHKVKWHL